MEEYFYIVKIIEELEKKNLKSKQWTNYELEALSNDIQEASQILISVSTLKRLFGKIKTHAMYNPQIETKNALAIYLGYRHWQDFKDTHKQNIPPVPTEKTSPGEVPPIGERIPSVLTPPEKAPAAVIPPWAWLTLAVGILGILGFIFLTRPANRVTPGMPGKFIHRFSFTAKNVKGVAPITTVFHYDVSRINADSILLDFGTNRIFAPPTVFSYLPRDKHIISKNYILPKFYKARLIAHRDTLATIDVHALSQGWQAFVFNNNYDVLGEVKPYVRNGQLYYPHPEIIRSFESLKGQAYQLELRNIRDFAADGDNVTLEIRLRNNPKQASIRCIDQIIQLLGDQRNVRVTFTSKGCVTWSRLVFGEVYLDGNFNDLSDFGRELAEWAIIRLEIRGKKVNVFINDQRIFTTSYRQPVGKIKGMIVGFTDGGMIDYIHMKDAEQRTVYSDEFGGGTASDR